MASRFLIRTINSSRQSGIFSPAATVAQHVLGKQIYDSQASSDLVNYTQTRGAARKGKRILRNRLNRLNAARKRLESAKNQAKRDVLKASLKLDSETLRFVSERDMDAKLPQPPQDNVYFFEKYRKTRFSFEDIIDFHRQVAHPDVTNRPDALITAIVELNLKMKLKKKRYIDRIESTVCYPNTFQYQLRPRKIVALCKDVELQQKALAAGAFMVGSADIAQLLKSSQLTQRDFDHLVVHNDFLEDFAAVKTMKAQPYFPTKARGNFGDNIEELVRIFKDGVDYSLKKHLDEKAFGTISCYLGRMDMTTEQLKENIVALFASINRFKPMNLADDKQFFERVLITSEVSKEIFALKYWDLIDDYKDPDAITEDDGDQNESKLGATAN